MFSFLPKRTLNGSPNGEIIAGINFHMPFAPEFGISAYARIPTQSPKNKEIDPIK
jgi:hypothetical protein